jgi:hypothetical protein
MQTQSNVPLLKLLFGTGASLHVYSAGAASGCRQSGCAGALSRLIALATLMVTTLGPGRVAPAPQEI